MTLQVHANKAREYETIYILRSSVDPDEADRVATRLSEVVDRLSGKMTKVDNWGKRKLAFPIEKSPRGVFVYMRYVGFGDMVAEIERNLRMLDSVVRFQTVQIAKDVNVAEMTIDPEEVKFRRLEVTVDEPEPNLEQRLGMVEEPRESRSHSVDSIPPVADEIEAVAAVADEAAEPTSEGEPS